MLSPEENRLITQVGPGTPMGNLFRRHWLPALLSSELPEADSAPVRLRLLGEDLVAFRTTSGQVGVMDTYCSGAATKRKACVASTTAGSSTWKASASTCLRSRPAAATPTR